MSLRMLVYWDSIGEGGNTVDVHHNNFDIQRNDALPTFAFSAAEAVGAELSLMAWGGQGEFINTIIIIIYSQSREYIEFTYYI